MKKKTVSLLLAACAVILIGAVVGLAVMVKNYKDQVDTLNTRLDEYDALIPVEIDPETVLAKIGDEVITYQQMYDAIEEMAAEYGDTLEDSDQATINELIFQELHALVESKVIDAMVKEMSITLEEADVKLEAETQYNEIVDYYSEELMAQETDLSEADARVQAEALMADYGMDLATIEESVRSELLSDAVRERIASDLISERTGDAALKEAFDNEIADAKARYEEGPDNFEFELYYFGSPVFYVPEGYRSVKHVLILFDEDTQAKATELYSELEDSNTSDERKGELRAELEGLKAPYADKIAEIESLIASNPDFDALIEAHGDDPAMEEEGIKEKGYYISAASDFWDPSFKDASMALATPGDVSEPVVTSSGIHFIKYLGEVPSGPVAYETVREALMDEVISLAKEEAYLQAYEEWSEKLKIELFDDILETAEDEEYEDSDEFDISFE